MTTFKMTVANNFGEQREISFQVEAPTCEADRIANRKRAWAVSNLLPGLPHFDFVAHEQYEPVADQS